MDRRGKWLMVPCVGLFQAVVAALFVGQPTLAASFWNYDEAVTVRKGSDLSITCTFEGIESFLDVVRVVHVQGWRSLPISDNGIAKLPYSQLPRYNVTYRHFGDKASVTVSYHGIQPEDSGMMKCERLDIPEESSFLNITVLSPPSDLYIIAVASDGLRTRTDGETILLEENQKLGVGCIAVVDGNVDDIPPIRVVIGDEDVASRFNSTVKTASVELESGLRLVRSEVSAVLWSDRPNPDFNGKTLRCSVDQSNGDIIEASANLQVKYAPVIVCSDLEWKVRVDDLVRIGCNVKANPSARIEWDFAAESDETLAEQGNIIFSKTNVSEDRSHVDMTITEIRDSQFRSYRLTAENEVGRVNVTLAVIKQTGPVAELSRDPNPQKNGDNGNSGALQPRQFSVIRETGNAANSFRGILMFQAMFMTSSLYLVF